jgi:hypothetical protein
MSSNASAIDLAARNLDIWARGVDLLTALTETANSSNSVVHVGIEIGRWLGREKLSENQLQLCLEKARGLVIANSKGNKFYEAVISGTRERAVGPLFTQPSGSLGRLMAKDPYLCWMTSTIACLFEFHSEDFISDVLCSFIMQAHTSREGKPFNEYQLAWHPLRLQLKPVLDKIVSSIWYNVVNSGVVKSGQLGSNTSLPLPDEIRDICPRGHNIESHDLGSIFNELQNPQKELVIESENVTTNLTLWLLYHFKGRFRVVVSGKIVFETVLGPEESTIEYRAQKFCKAGGPCDTYDSGLPTPKVRIYSSVGGQLKKLFSGKYDTQMTLEQNSRARQKLYRPQYYPSGASGKDSIQVLTRRTAYAIVRWLLDLGLRLEEASNEISFIIDDQNGQAKPAESITVANILARIPAIVNKGWGNDAPAMVVFAAPVANVNKSATVDNFLGDSDDGMDTEEENFGIEDGVFSSHTPEYVVQYFPVLRDLLEEVKKSCRCHECRTKKGLKKLQPGCMQHTAFMEVMLYIAHSISDGFGADDCSALISLQRSDHGVLNILGDAIGGSIRWKYWFDTASRVVLGCPSIDDLRDDDIDEDYTTKSNFADARDLASTVIAVQHGNLAVVSPWLDITKSLNLHKCFGFDVVQGRLGILAEERGLQFQSLQGNTVILETQHTDDVQSFSEKFPLVAEKIGSEIQIKRDESEAKTDYILVQSGESRYKLLMRVISNSHSRFLDPARAMIKAIQPVISISCKHKFDRSFELPSSAPTLKLYSFDQVLGRWPDAVKGATDDYSNAPRRGGSAQEAASGSEMEEDFPAGQHFQIPKVEELPRASSNETPTLRVSHLLGSHFKYNVALALAYDDPTIMNYQTACLACILEEGLKVDAINGVENVERNRWVICRDKSPDSKEDDIYRQAVQARKKLKLAV